MTLYEFIVDFLPLETRLMAVRDTAMGPMHAPREVVGRKLGTARDGMYLLDEAGKLLLCEWPAEISLVELLDNGFKFYRPDGVCYAHYEFAPDEGFE